MKLMTTLVLAGALAFGQGSAEVELKAALHKEQVEGDLKGAIAAYQKVIARHAKNRTVAAQAMFQMAQCHERMGQGEAQKLYARIVREYGDQAGVAAQARAKLGTAAGGGGMSVRQIEPAGLGCMPHLLGARVTDCHRPDGIYVRDLETGQERLVVLKASTKGRLLPGTMSPDGRTLVYFNTETGMRAVGADGTADRALGRAYAPETNSVPYLYGNWTAGGRQLLALMLAADQSGVDAALVSVADGKQTVLRRVEPGGPGAQVVLSPDEKYVAFKKQRGVVDGITILPLGGGAPIPVTGTGRVDRLVGWHASGRLLYTSDRAGGSMGIWAVMVKEGTPQGEPQFVHDGLHPQQQPWLGRDGAIHYEKWGAPTQVLSARLDAAAGTLSQPKPATKLYSGGNWLPVFSSDGKSMAYATAFAPGAVKFVIQDLEKGTETAYSAPFRTVANVARWTPDGSALIVHAMMNQNDPYAYYRFVPATGETKLLVKTDTEMFSVHGEGLYYTGGRTQPGAVLRMDLSDGTVEKFPLPGNPERLLGALISPDGANVAYVYGVGEPVALGARPGAARLAVAPLRGGAEKVVTEAPLANWRGPAVVAWTADSKGLLYNRPASDGGQELWLASVDGGEPRKVHSSSAQFFGISVHPNGRDVALATRELDKASFFVIENAFASR
jgi:Tol biopolymer transport system component